MDPSKPVQYRPALDMIPTPPPHSFLFGQVDSNGFGYWILDSGILVKTDGSVGDELTKVGEYTITTPPSSGQGNGVAVDEVNGMVYVSWSRAICKVRASDLTAGDQTIAPVGTCFTTPSLSNPYSMALDVANGYGEEQGEFMWR